MRLLALVATALTLAVVLLAACATPAGKRARAAPQAAPAVRLQWASTEYFQAGPDDPVVELRIVLDNGGIHTTDSTTILWEPSFQQNFTFLRSEPAAWRVRVDEAGRGVVDTSGTIPGQDSTFRLWFAAEAERAAKGHIVQEPKVLVVVDGNYVVAETIATATHLRLQAAAATQQTFERGPLAATADLARFVPDDQRSALPLAILIGLAMSLMALAGGCAAYRLAGHRP